MAKSDEANTMTAEQMQDRITELELLIQEMAAQLNAVTRAQLHGAGVDAAVMARRNLGRKTGQFTRNYNRLPQPSSVKGGPNLIDGYAIGAWEVVKIRVDELDRINADFPDLIEEDVKKFKSCPRHVPTLTRDDQGRPVWRMDPKPVPVDELIKIAPEVG